MKIKNIRINNFKSIIDKEYSPKNKVAVLCASNGVGKTSFLEALRFGLTGEAPDNCINDRADEMSVEITLEKDDLTMERIKHITKPTKVRVNGKVTTAKHLETALFDNAGLTKDTLKTSTSQEVLAAMKPDALGAFLMGYVPEEVDFDTVVKFIPGASPEVVEELQSYLPAMPDKFGLDTVENAYKAIFEARTYTNKDRQRKSAQIDIAVVDAPIRSLADVEKEEKDIVFKEGAQVSAKAAMDLYLSAISIRKNAEKSIEDLQKQIDAINVAKPKESEIVEIKAAINKATEKISDANKIIAMIENNLETFENTLANLDKPVCPISEKLVCTTDKSTIKEELAELIQANKEGADIQKKIIAEEREKIAELQKRENDWNENNRAYTQKVTLVNRLAAEKKNLPPVPARPSTVPDAADYTVRKQELKRERAYCEAYERNQQLMRESEALEKRYIILDALCTALAPKGDVMSGITATYLSIFEGVINKRAAELGTGYLVQFIADNGVNYTIKTPASTTYHSYADLSCGEQLVAIFLLLDMLNALCGTRIMLLDDLNHLDSDNFGVLLSLVNSKAFQDDYDHVFICAAKNTDIEKALATVTDIDILY